MQDIIKLECLIQKISSELFKLVRKIQNKNTFRFFNYKWKKVPTWAIVTEKKYVNWYIKRYKYKNKANLKKFLKTKQYILEAGCGLARDSKLFADLNKKAKIYACDQSINSIRIARRNLKDYKNINIFRQDITKKFSKKIKYDFISCDQVLHHTPKPGKTLKNLYSCLNKNGYLNFFVCRKKNVFRDFIDDEIMNYFKDKSPNELWDFSVKVTKFAKNLHDLKITNLSFGNKKYNNLQLFFHYNSFRAWYDPKINFDLSVSSNYDWFSNNPRYSLTEIKKILYSNLRKFKLISIYEDDASISISIRKL